MDIAELGLRVSSDGFVRADSAMNKFNRTASHTEKQAQKISKQFDGIRKMAGMLTAALSVRAIQRYSDEWTDLNSRILNATKSQENAKQVMDAIAQTARRTYSSLNQTAEAYLNNAMTLTELGYSTQRQIELSDSLNNALVVSGTKGDQAASVMNALSKALAFGELRGENFNTIIQSGGRVVEALADGMGVTTLELRKMAEQGLLKTGKVVDALTSQMEKLRAEADAMPATIGDGFLLINNALQQFVGRMNDATGASSYLADFLVDIADAIDTISAALASGQGDLYIRAWVGQWEQAASDIMTALDMIRDFSAGASGQVTFSWKKAFLDIPANLTAAIQLMGASWAYIISFADLTAKTVADAFIAQFTTIKNVAALTGEAIIAGLNPFDKGPSADEWKAALTDPFQSVLDQFNTQAGILNSTWDDTRDSIFSARDAAITASDDLRAKGDEMRKAWEANRGVFEDVATGIKSAGAAADLTYEQIVKLNSEMDKLLKGDLFAFGDSSDGAQKIVDGLQDQYNQLVLNEKQLKEVARAHLLVQLTAEKASDAQIKKALELFDLMANTNAILEAQRQNDPLAHWANTIDAVADGIGKMQGALQNGSKEAKKLGIALQALAVVQGIIAVLNQGQGDPYTAFARMAAMAASVVALGVQIGSMSGGEDQTAANRQKIQGTGTVFGDTAAKSESILKASEITATATSELVGLQRGMLHALQRMEDGISNAIVGLVRGNFGDLAGGINTSTEYSKGLAKVGEAALVAVTFFIPFLAVFAKEFGSIAEKASKDLYRVKQKIVDTGIAVLGGSMGDILSGSIDFALAYAEVEKKKKILGISAGKSVDTVTQALDDEVSRTIMQIVEGMADAVSSAAEVLGISNEEIQKRISEYEVAAQNISLLDLSPEEQQEQLSAVFGAIFDGLSAQVVPFVREFSQIGEGYAETLIRIATQVQVAEEASKQLGFAIEDNLSPEQMARFADELVNAGGGIEDFIGKLQSFVSAFATDEHKLSVASRNISEALSQIGLEVPETREALWDLMGTLTDPAQINALLDLTKSFDTYFSAIDRAQRLANEYSRKEAELFELTGRSAEALIIVRRLELEAMDESLHEIQLRIWAIQDEEAALQKLREAIQSAALLSDSALDGLRKSVDAEKKRITAEYDLAVKAVNAQFDAKIAKAESDYARRADNLTRVLDRTRESMSDLLALSDALRAASQANRIETDELNRARRQGAQSVITGALATGNLSGVERALETLTQPSESLFGTFEEWAIDAAVTANQLSALADRTEMQASAQERTVMQLEARAASAAEQHKQLIFTLNEQRAEQLAALEFGYNEQILALDQIVLDAEQMLNVLRGIDTTIYSIDESLDRFSDAIIDEFVQRQAISNDQMNISLISINEEITDMKERLADLSSKQLKELELQTNEMLQEAS